MTPAATIPPLSELLIEDEASRFADSLKFDERKAHYETNGLGDGSPELSDDEYEAMMNIFAPQ